MEDHAGPLLDHAPSRGARGEEVAREAVDHGAQEIVRRHLDQRGALDVPATDEVERHVDAAGLGDHVCDVFVDGPLVEGVEDRDLGQSARPRDLVRHGVELVARPPDEEDPGPFSREGATPLPISPPPP